MDDMETQPLDAGIPEFSLRESCLGSVYVLLECSRLHLCFDPGSVQCLLNVICSEAFWRNRSFVQNRIVLGSSGETHLEKSWGHTIGFAL